MQRIFAALRAPVHVNFQFKDYTTKLLGADPGKLQKMSSNPEAQCPDLPVVEELHNSFKLWEQQPGVCSLMAICIVFVFPWLCFCGGVVVFLWWCGCVCGCVVLFVVVWLFFCGGVVVFLWWCLCVGCCFGCGFL